MKKLYVAIDDESENDILDDIIDGSCYMERSLDKLIEVIDDGGDSVDGMEVYVFEMTDKGIIKSTHKYSFVSSNPVENIKGK